MRNLKKIISLLLVCATLLTLTLSASAVTLADLKNGEDDAGNTYDNSDTGVYNSTKFVSQYAKTAPTMDGVLDEGVYSLTSKIAMNAQQLKATATGSIRTDDPSNAEKIDTDFDSALYSANDSENLYLFMTVKDPSQTDAEDQIFIFLDFENTDNNECAAGATNYTNGTDYMNEVFGARKADNVRWFREGMNISKTGGLIWLYPNKAASKNTVNDVAISNAADSVALKWGESTTGYAAEIKIPLPEAIKSVIAKGEDVVIGMSYVTRNNNTITETFYIQDKAWANYAAKYPGNFYAESYDSLPDVVLSGAPATTQTSTTLYGVQTTVPDTNGDFAVRFIGALNTSDYTKEQIGFCVSYNGSDAKEVSCTKIYNMILANYGEKTYNSVQVGGDYIYALVLTDLNTSKTHTFTVSAYYKDADNNTNETDTVTYVITYENNAVKVDVQN